jgi:hypothetical protein
MSREIWKQSCWLERFIGEYAMWRGLAPHDYRGAPWIRDGADGIMYHRSPFFIAVGAAWSNSTCMWPYWVRRFLP